MPLAGEAVPWVGGLFGFVQVDREGLPVPLPAAVEPVPPDPLWQPLVSRLERLARVRGGTADWLSVGLDRGDEVST